MCLFPHIEGVIFNYDKKLSLSFTALFQDKKKWK